MIELSEMIKQVTSYIDLLVGGNDFAGGIIIGGLMSVGTYLLKDVPRSIKDFIIKHSTTTITLNNNNESYFSLLDYLQTEGLTATSRYLNVGNGRWGYSKSSKQIGYGSQIFWYQGRPLKISISCMDSHSEKIKEKMTIVKLGRSHTLFDDLLEASVMNLEDKESTTYFKFEEKFQKRITVQRKYSPDNVILSAANKDILFKGLDNFINKEDWFRDNGLPYQLGILLSGPPGTGKTSLIKGIATYMDKHICFVNSLSNLVLACQEVEGSIIVIEEVDTFGIGSRDLEDDKGSKDSNKVSVDEMLLSMSGQAVLGNLLTALDGIISNHGRVVIMTTNNPEVLDKALLRPGRIDLNLVLDYIDVDMFFGLLRKFFGDNVKLPSPSEFSIVKELSPAKVQADIILGASCEDLLKKYRSE